MVPLNTEVSIAITLVETVMIILPIWLAGIRYFMESFKGAEDPDHLFVESIILIYVSLAAVLVNSGIVITDLGNEQLSMSVYGLWLLFFATGAITFRLVQRRSDSWIERVFLWVGIIIGGVFLIVSFGLMVMVGI
jgi:hypothetical protein